MREGMGISFNLDSINLMQIGYSEFIGIANDGNYSHNGCYTQANTMCDSKGVGSAVVTLYTLSIYPSVPYQLIRTLQNPSYIVAEISLKI